MTQIKKPWARYDREFPNDDHVLAMPAKVRAPAYALLLAVNGYCYGRALVNPPATGRLTLAEVAAIADKIGQRPRPLVDALLAVGLMVLEGREVSLPRFFEWNPELTPVATARRTEAAKAGAAARWSGGDAVSHAPEHAVSHAVSDAVSDAVLMPEIRERERHRDRAPLPLNPLSPEALAICQAFEARGQGISERDKQDAEGMVSEFRIPTAGEFAEEIRTTDQERVTLQLQPLRRVMGYRERFRRLNDRLRDEGRRPRESEIRSGGGMTSIASIVGKVATR